MAVTINVLLNRAADAAGRRLDPARRRVGTVAEAFRRRGLRGAVAALGARAPFGLLSIDWYEIYETTAVPEAAETGGMSVARSTARDAAQLSALRGETADAMGSRFASGDIAYVARDDDSVIGFIWIRSGTSPEGVIEFGISDDERWAYDLYVHPAYRGRRIGPALKRHAVADLAGDGVRRVLSRIEHLNEPSRRAARSYGARVVGSFAVVSIPGLVMVHERCIRSGKGAWSVFPRSRTPVRRTLDRDVWR